MRHPHLRPCIDIRHFETAAEPVAMRQRAITPAAARRRRFHNAGRPLPSHDDVALCRCKCAAPCRAILALLCGMFFA